MFKIFKNIDKRIINFLIKIHLPLVLVRCFKIRKRIRIQKLFALEADKILGLGITEFLKKNKIPTEIKKKVFLREKFRQNKDWQKADAI